MRFIVDENLGLSYAQRLRDMGYDAVHVCEVGLGETDDQIIVEYAQSKGLIIITFDLDFSRSVALGKLELPSVITFRLGKITKDIFQAILQDCLPRLEDTLMAGALATITEHKIRVQPLPVG